MTTPGPYQPYQQQPQQPPIVAGPTYGQPYGQQPPAPSWTPPPVTPKRKSKAPLWASLIGLVLFLCAVGGVVAVLADGGEPASTATGGTVTTAAGDAKAGQKAPTVKDVKLTAKITEQTCCGSGIGCAVTWHPEVSYVGAGVADSMVWKISYTVSGLESGTAQGTIVMGGTTPAKQSDKHGRTKGKDTKIVLKVTGVEAG